MGRLPIKNPPLEQQGESAMRRLLVVATVALVLAAAGAFAGEVKGPPGTVNNTNETGALKHANSACAASGLNDLDSEEGQTVSQVQTAADSWKFYELPKGAPGKLGLCKGGTGQR
jgi:hypothetical protein